MCAADRACRDAAAATAAAAAVSFSMIICIYIYIYIYYITVKKLASFLRNYVFSKKVNYLLRKYDFRSKMRTFRRKLIICFENMIRSFKNMPKRHQNGMSQPLSFSWGVKQFRKEFPLGGALTVRFWRGQLF